MPAAKTRVGFIQIQKKESQDNFRRQFRAFSSRVDIYVLFTVDFKQGFM